MAKKITDYRDTPALILPVYPYIKLGVDLYPAFLVIMLCLFVITKLPVGKGIHKLSQNVHLLGRFKVMPVFCHGVQIDHFLTIFCDSGLINSSYQLIFLMNLKHFFDVAKNELKRHCAFITNI